MPVAPQFSTATTITALAGSLTVSLPPAALAL